MLMVDKFYILKDFPMKIDKNVHPFFRVTHELPIEEDIILTGSYVFSPSMFRKFILYVILLTIKLYYVS